MKLSLEFETELQEFKTSLGELDKGILSLTAMLNKYGKGRVYFGVANNGEVLGLSLGEETIKKISRRISEIVKPTIIPKILVEEYNGKIVIAVEVEGINKPYSSGGEYRIRVGSENKKIDPDQLGELFFSNSAAMIENVESINQTLTFQQLKQLYISKGLKIDDSTFAFNIGLLTKKGTYNYLAEILSDYNNCSIKVVRFAGKDKLNMVARNEYGYKCMLLALKQAYDYVESLNETHVNLEKGLERKEEKLFDIKCFDEAWLNACLHNRWVKNVPPAVYIFDDRMEIISTGGLPIDYSEDEFFAGISHPVNAALQKIMGQLGMIEQTGHGVPLIVSKYGRDAFELAENHITVTIPFSFEPSMKTVNYDGLIPSQTKVLKTLKENPLSSIEVISKLVGLGKTRVSDIISELKRMNKIERVGGRKGGYWKVF